MNEQECQHQWVANSGRGGEPSFAPISGSPPVMHVMCSACGDRTWLTQAQWKATEQGGAK